MVRRFPPPWTAEVTSNYFIVCDANGQALSYIYYESEPGRRSAAKLLSKDEARRIAANFPPQGQLMRLSSSSCDFTNESEIVLEFCLYRFPDFGIARQREGCPSLPS